MKDLMLDGNSGHQSCNPYMSLHFSSLTIFEGFSFFSLLSGAFKFSLNSEEEEVTDESSCLIYPSVGNHSVLRVKNQHISRLPTRWPLDFDPCLQVFKAGLRFALSTAS